MGHTRLGPLPKTKSWNQVVDSLTGGSFQGYSLPDAASRVSEIAAQTLKAAKVTLAQAKTDAGVRYTFYLLTQIASASRGSNWEQALASHGIRLSGHSTVFDLTVEVQGAIDRHLSRTSHGSSDLGEMAQQAVGEALTSLLSAGKPGLFDDSDSDDLKDAVRQFSTKKGFGQLGQRFFGNFLARFLNFHLSRATAAGLGSPRLQNMGKIGEFNNALNLHCDQSARIVRDFCGEWYSKTQYEQGINPSNSARFLAIAVRKLRSELQHQESAS